MFNLKIMLRNLRRGGIYSAINIGGLAIGMAASALLLSWVLNQWSYDRFHTKTKQIHQVWYRGISMNNKKVVCEPSTSIVIGTTLKNEFPEIAEVVRISFPDSYYFGEGDRFMSMRTRLADPSFLTVFSFPLLKGDANTALNDPFSVVITEKAALRLFGNEEPMGKTLMCMEYPVTVTGVMKNLPNNTRFDFEILGSFQFGEKTLPWNSTSWRSRMIETYVELTPLAQLDRLNTSVSDVVKNHSDAQSDAFLYPLEKSYLYNRFENGVPSGGGVITFLRILIILAGIILLTACINFVNLSIARATMRAKEVGVRKALGSRRLGLIRLFLSESIILASISGIIAFIIVFAAMPSFSGWFSSGLIGELFSLKTFSLDIFSMRFWLFALAFILFTGVLAGSYPAFYLSAFSPVKVLKGISRIGGSRRITLRKVLVTFQFFVAIFLIVVTLVVRRQIIYATNIDTGYNKENLIRITLTDEINQHYQAFRNDLMATGVITDITRTKLPMSRIWNTTAVTWQGKNPEVSQNFYQYVADGNWAEMMGIELVAGRYPNPAVWSTDSSAILLSELAVKVIGLDNPIGETISFLRQEGHVIGVFKDLVINSPLFDENYPMVVGCSEKFGSYEMLHIRLSPGKMTGKLASIENVFKQYSPGIPFDYKFIDEEYMTNYFTEMQAIESLASLFTVVSVLISCMGLFALVAITAERRRKEIGIRKIMGASVASITFLLSKEYIVLTLIAYAIAAPLAWFGMSQLLNMFHYRTTISVWLILVVGALILLITILTVGFQAIKAATANPVNAIKSE